MIELSSAEVLATTLSGEVRVLHPISLRVSEPRVALIGANGSGKSTLARLLNGLIEPTSGSVRITTADGRTYDTVRDGAAVRRHVGFMFTDPAAQLVMPTPLEDVTLSLRRSHRSAGDRLAAARAALERFGLADLADQSVHTLSGGQKQLLALATVLATEPEVLIADEPTTLLDLRNSHRIGDLLMSLPQQLVIATHDLDLAARCDRVIVIADGAVVHDSAVISADSSADDSAQISVHAAIDWYRASVT
ncbi:MAG: ABC transporter ATP-binding protein [Microbacteriaceae bacterium]|nr:ABC transporter ATP-binding protein [Microbacteriaceae bacterium]